MILSIDLGTTGITAIVFRQDGSLAGRAYAEFAQYYPEPGWVEQDPVEIWQTCERVVRNALANAQQPASALVSIGITNQRETMLLWHRDTGAPVHRAIVWQCRRSVRQCESLRERGLEPLVREKTGLVVDAYFSATKLAWLMEERPEIKSAADSGKLCFGTIDTWIIWKLTGGHAHVTDHTNACRTMLYNIESRDWDPELLEIFGCHPSLLPKVLPSAARFGVTAKSCFFGAEVPITGVAGDQQAALFGQQCTEPGMVKNTYGTGCFVLMYAGEQRPQAEEGLLVTLACDVRGRPAYAVEGAVFTAGAAVQWLRDEMGMIGQAAETEAIAEAIPDTRGVYLVPAFVGLGAPHWDMDARGTLVGLTRGAGRSEVVRATLESIAYQTRDLVKIMRQEGVPIKSMRADGGASANNFLMQFQADILNLEVERPALIESTALGAALLAGVGCGLWQPGHLPTALTEVERRFTPAMEDSRRATLLGGWQRAVRQARHR